MSTGISTSSSGSPTSVDETAGEATAEVGSGDTGSNSGCGDGVLEAGEDCDDGNDADGDGCSANCVRSGTILWERTMSGPVDGDDQLLSAIFLPTGDLVVGGGEADGGEQINGHAQRDMVLMRLADSDGALVWAWRHATAGHDAILTLAVTPEARVAAGGVENHGGPAPTWAGWVGRFTTQGELAFSDSLSELDHVRSTAFRSGGLVAVGSKSYEETGTDAKAAFYAESSPVIDTLVDSDLPGSDDYQVVGLDTNADVVVAGNSLGDDSSFGTAISISKIVIEGPTIEPVQQLELRPGMVRLSVQAAAIAPGGSLIALAGYEEDASGARDVLLRRVDLSEGKTSFSPPSTPMLSEELEALAFDDAGNVVVAGFVSLEGQDAYIAKYAPDGSLMWQRDYVRPGDGAIRGLAVRADAIGVAGQQEGEDGTEDLWAAILTP